ncbi:alpha-N-acetylglucosaminidase [uncultured Rikenella sp.]|uniref:alpha-N-acetylglucosaminidase n=1 Tax=uncultured Rikenella sp. TaxID=368003 RepID=UPI00261F2C28|nr:alpha-N-acetylglucosaminidase [uncultured Rikenella sp.]
MRRLSAILLLLLLLGATPRHAFGGRAKNPVAALVERIQPGQSSRFVFELAEQQSPDDFFELDSKGGKIVIRGNNYISIAAGLNWYLKYYAGIQITWNNPRPRLSNVKFPRPKQPERHETDMLVRYYMNYCTFSYSTAFWDWERWEREIDWMALHGINLPLSLTGTATVWRNTLRELGFDKTQIDAFIAGPAHQAWWLMNNLEGWGGPNPEDWYDKQAELEQRIVARYREWGIQPVFAGYGGMVPSDTAVWRKLGLSYVQDPGLWCGYRRPAFLQPVDSAFAKIADTYYKNLKALYGEDAKYFAIDPFHEGGSTQGVDLPAAGAAIYAAMKRANPGAVWVVQGWQSCPHPAMIRDLPGGDVLVLDLFSESRPMWGGDLRSPWRRVEGYGRHDWVYCMLLNFGGNVGMYGKMQRVIDSYYLARDMRRADSACARFLKGVGTTPEGIENNPILFELLYELPWRPEKFDRMRWVADYVRARYGHTLPQVEEAWRILANTVYDPPYESLQEGTTESVFCARPALRVERVSSWGTAELAYDARETERALGLLLEVAERFQGCNNFEYDLVDVARQAAADKANGLLKRIEAAYDKGAAGKAEFRRLSDEFLELILLQDDLLSSRPEFMVGPWIEQAMRWGGRWPEQQAFYRWNARTLLTTWGNRHAANIGGLHDYAHREWAGMLRDFYYPRWKTFFDAMNRGELPPADYYPMEAEWAAGTQPYPIHAETNPIDMAWKIYNRLIKM